MVAWRPEIKTRVVDRSGTRLADCHWTNARLIAAAPDLLEACRALVSDCWRRSGVGLQDHEDGCEDCRAARAAIARAEGPS